MPDMSIPGAFPRIEKFSTEHCIDNMHLQIFDGCSHPLKHKCKVGGS